MSKITIYITTSLLLIYFIFTSGFMFEITKSEATYKIDIPYSIGLSAERTGIATLATQDDMKCFEWLKNNWDNRTDIVGDYNSHLMIAANVPNYFFLHKNKRSEKSMLERLNNMPNSSCYLFVSSWNTEHKQFIEATGVGFRTTYPMPEMNYPVLYQSGNSIVYKKEPLRK